MGRYFPLISFEATHGFFSDGLCHQLRCVATSETNTIISKAGLMSRNMTNGVRVFYDRDRLDSLRSQAADQEEPLDLTFKVFSRDKLFMIYTTPPTYADDAILYFDSSRVQSDTGAKIRLHQEEYLGEADLEGFGSALLDGVLNSWDRLVKPLMVVKIRFTSNEAEFLAQQPPVTPKTYIVNFRAAETIWKFYLLGEVAKEGLYIADLDYGIGFESGQPETLSDARPTLTFRSKTHIPLQERSGCRFQLRERNAGTGRVLIRRLPVASAKQIGREVVAGEPMHVSKMFINC